MLSVSFSQGICTGLVNPANGVVYVTGLSAQDIATYACNPGYELVGPTSLTCQSHDVWSDDPPVCRRKHSFITVHFSQHNIIMRLQSIANSIPIIHI